MTANQRRPGFRLPWSPEADEAAQPGEGATNEADTPSAASGAVAPDAAAAEAGPTVEGAAEMTPEPVEADWPAAEVQQAPAEPASAEADAVIPGAADAQVAASETPVEAPSANGAAPAAEDFMRDLVSAMRGVADEARQNSLADLRSRAEDQVRRFQADAEQRVQELRSRADADVAGVGEWASAEQERIKAEAEQRIVSRRAQLDQQLAADTARTDGDTKAVRDRVAEYERELDAFTAQLADISDPAAFAAAAKRMPKPPTLTGASAPASEATPEPQAAAEPRAEVEPPVAADASPVDASVATGGQTNGVPASPEAAVKPGQDEALAARLAALDATLPADAAAGSAETDSGAGEPAMTEVIVKGLGSFGAITGFRQALSGVEGIDAVALSLGQTGEFVFRATHGAGFDVRGAIAKLEGDGAKIEERPEGGLRVTLDRPR